MREGTDNTQIRLFEIVDLEAYADDNYMGGVNQNLAEAIQVVKDKTEAVTKWMSSSGLKINELKFDNDRQKVKDKYRFTRLLQRHY